MINFAKRRQHFFEQLLDDSITLLPAAQPLTRNNDAEHAFRQHSDFYYLTGFNEPRAIAVFIKSKQQQQFILFNHPDDPNMTIWEGKRVGQEGAIAEFGADEAYDIDLFTDYLPELLAGKSTLYYPLGFREDIQALLNQQLINKRLKSRVAAGMPETWINLDTILHEMRLIKTDEEIACIQYAVDSTVQGFERVFKRCQPGLHEYQMEAELRHAFCDAGCRHMAYTAIVGGGNNSCVLHYINNDQPLHDGDLLLIDAGAEYQYYAADITRTFPINGRFSTEQQAVYEIVLASQYAGIAALQVNQPWTGIQQAIVQVIAQGLIDLGILTGTCEQVIESEAYKQFYMHQSGHWLGLDVHDVGSYRQHGQSRLLEPNMVLTVEPGIYIPVGAAGVDEKWQGIGVRIEDDVRVTEQGPHVLSQALAKEIKDIEAIMNS